MSRVTIDRLACDYWDAIDVTDDSYADKIAYIEVIPRKIVEMIIEHCERESEIKSYHDGVRVEAREIKEYAESLLRLFEGGEDK